MSSTVTSSALENMNRIMECSICFETFLDKPIFQCPEGHILCSTCVEVYTGGACPTCGVAMPKHKIRNRALEFIGSNKAALDSQPAVGPTPEPALPPATDVPNPKKYTRKLANRSRYRSVHEGCVCDGPICQGVEEKGDIRGIRYKCTICDDYDLCEDCVDAGVHKNHVFLRFATKTQFTKYSQKKAKNVRSKRGNPAGSPQKSAAV